MWAAETMKGKSQEPGTQRLQTWGPPQRASPHPWSRPEGEGMAGSPLPYSFLAWLRDGGAGPGASGPLLSPQNKEGRNQSALSPTPGLVGCEAGRAALP